MEQKTLRMALVTGGLLLVGTFGLLWVYGEGQELKKSPAVQASVASGKMDDATRLQYVAEHVDVQDLLVEHDKKPDSEEAVGGLMRVSGVVYNRGPRPISKVVVAIYPKNEAGKVTGSYFEDVLNDASLGAGEQRNFKFLIPQKKDYSGTFDYELR